MDSWRTTYAGIISNEVLGSLTYDGREEMWRNRITSPPSVSSTSLKLRVEKSLDLFAQVRSASVIRSLKAKFMRCNCFDAINDRVSAAGLFYTALKNLLENGLISMLVWILADNPARGFYEALGGIYLREKEIEIGDQHLIEIA